MEGRYGRDDRHPQHNDFNERQVRTAQAEEYRRPGSIQHQLHEIDRERQHGAGEGIPASRKRQSSGRERPRPGGTTSSAAAKTAWLAAHTNRRDGTLLRQLNELK